MHTREELFLKKNGLDIENIDREAILKAFDEEMAAGLAGNPSSLMMIPSYISIDQPVKTNTPVIVLDAGGTNLRVAVVTINAAGKPEIGAFHKSSMPGTRSEIGVDDFFEAFADFLLPVVEQSDTIGFCFSYPAEILPDCDARLIRWSKQIQARSVEGQLIGSGLKKHLAKRGYNHRIVILNDTVATLLAGKSVGVTKNYAAYVGFILGTGTNTAYVAGHAQITKCPNLTPAGSMAINVESGAFRRVEQTVFDRLMDAETIDPGYYTFEKMISGAYLGTLGLTILHEAVKADLFSPAAAAAITGLKSLSSKDLDDFCGGAATPETPFMSTAFSETDHATVIHLCLPIYQRAAILTAINLASAILRTGAGHDPARPVCVNVDGSTYYRTRTADFPKLVQRELQELLAPRGIAYELIQVDDSPVIGAAVAGLM